MIPGEKNPNLKDSSDTKISVKDIPLSVSYTKTNKLITGLYMVTDIIDKEEPIKAKLRNLGTEIVSDMYLIQQNNVGHIEASNAVSRISETMSFLDIAAAMNLISEMNRSILKKEFIELKTSVQEYTERKNAWLEEFLDTPSRPPLFSRHLPIEVEQKNPQGHTRIGVQKGDTLMKALSDRTLARSFNATMSNSKNSTHADRNNFDILKKKRRDAIISIIKNNGGSATIKDINTKINIGVHASLTCSEKTLQRELVSMIKDGVLNKTGEKRWSRYFLKN